MKFLGLAVLFCLAASTLANVPGEADTKTEGSAEATSKTRIDAEGNTVVETTAFQNYALTYLQKGLSSMTEGFGKGGGFRPIEGTVNLLASGVLDTTRGLAKSLEPGVQAVYATPIPTVRILLAALKIKVCGPQTHLEYLLNHVVCFVNGPGRKTLELAPLPVCIPGREVQCHGPYLRVPRTLTPESKKLLGIKDEDLIQNVQLVKVDGDSTTPVGEPVQPTTTPAESSSAGGEPQGKPIGE